MFDQLIVSSAVVARTRVSRVLPMVTLLHATALAVLISIPLLFPKALPNDLGRLLCPMAVPRYTPPPPAPPVRNPDPVQAAAHPPAPPPNLDPNQMYVPPKNDMDVPPPDAGPWQNAFAWNGLEGAPGSGPAVFTGSSIGMPFGSGVAGTPATVPVAPVVPPPPPKPPRKVERVAAEVLLSRLVQRIEPAYPVVARTAGVQGTVVLQITVDTAGRVAAVRVVSGSPLLAQAAVDAVYRWVYTPTLVGGEPVSIIGTVVVKFTLNRG
jgi:protein TonB